jgi:hypothetical protein
MRIRLGDFRTDCSACDALCCTELTILNTNDLGQSKPAGKECPHLGANKRCTIYGERSLAGFSVCGQYDCLGAGPLTTQLFSGLKIDIENSALPQEKKSSLLNKWEAVRRKSFQDIQKTFAARQKRPAYCGQAKTLEQLIAESIEQFVYEVKSAGVKLNDAKSEFE